MKAGKLVVLALIVVAVGAFFTRRSALPDLRGHQAQQRALGDYYRRMRRRPSPPIS